MHANSKVRENFWKGQGILKSWNAGHPVNHSQIHLNTHKKFRQNRSSRLGGVQWHTHAQKKYIYKDIYIYVCFTFNIFPNQFNTLGSFWFTTKIILHSCEKIKIFMPNLLSCTITYKIFKMYFYLKNKNVLEKFGHLYIISDENHGNLKKIRELFSLTSVATL